MPIIIFDIDGTLADTEHRMHYIRPTEGKKKSWYKFFEASAIDRPFSHVTLLAKMLYDAGYEIIMLTARPESERPRTETWLAANDLKYKNLIMRPNGEHKADDLVKEDAYLHHFAHRKEELLMVFEDRLHVAKMWRKHGVPVMLCGCEWDV